LIRRKFSFVEPSIHKWDPLEDDEYE
jgi:hypothetical protein